LQARICTIEGDTRVVELKADRRLAETVARAVGNTAPRTIAPSAAGGPYRKDHVVQRFEPGATSPLAVPMRRGGIGLRRAAMTRVHAARLIPD